jgi:hypothetical protein
MGANDPPNICVICPIPRQSATGSGKQRYGAAVLRLAWPSLLLLFALVVLLARRPGLLASRAFLPVLLIAGALLLVGYRRRPPH